MYVRPALVFTLLASLATPALAQDYDAAPAGTRWLESPLGLRIKVLVESTNLGGGEVDVAEITFPAGPASPRGHKHTSIEIFYVLEGVLDHIVNGESHLLQPGMVGIVRPGDEVIHRVASQVPVKALVVWAPGGEAERISGSLKERPIVPDK